MNGKSHHLWSFHPWRSADWPSLSDLFLPFRLGYSPLTLTSWSTDGNSICFPDWNSLPLKREIHWKCPTVVMGWLVFNAILYFYHTLRTNVLPLSPAITNFAISYLCLRSIFLQALHPLFNVVCFCGGPVCLCCSLGAPWPPSLSSLFHDVISDGLMTFPYSAHHCFHLNLSPGSINWAGQVSP